MTIPDFQTMMRPVLAHLADGAIRQSRQVKEDMAQVYSLTQEERDRLLPSGKQRVMDNRVSWALSYLVQAGLVERPQRGQVRITQLGREALAANPDRIDMRTLEAYPGYRSFKERTRAVLPVESPGPQTVTEQTSTPLEQIETAVAQSLSALETDVLQRALALSPTGFEDLVMALLEKMGYGRLGTIERTSVSGDAGVDGIISQDPLGLDRIYVQAKRYAADRSVDRPRIHEFAGALLGKQGDRGVFITTSSFTTGARLEAERINARIELIDGSRLAGLLVRYGVGVQVQQTILLHRMDEDFFEGLG